MCFTPRFALDFVMMDLSTRMARYYLFYCLPACAFFTRARTRACCHTAFKHRARAPACAIVCVVVFVRARLPLQLVIPDLGPDGYSNGISIQDQFFYYLYYSIRRTGTSMESTDNLLVFCRVLRVPLPCARGARSAPFAACMHALRCCLYLRARICYVTTFLYTFTRAPS